MIQRIYFCCWNNQAIIDTSHTHSLPLKGRRESSILKITWLFFTARYLYKNVTKRCGCRESLLIYREVRRGGAGGQLGGHGHHGPTGNGLALPCKHTHTNQKRERGLFTSRQLIWCLNCCIFDSEKLEHRVYRVSSFFSSRQNLDSPIPSPAGECAPPPPPPP